MCVVVLGEFNWIWWMLIKSFILVGYDWCGGGMYVLFFFNLEYCGFIMGWYINCDWMSW